MSQVGGLNSLGETHTWETLGGLGGAVSTLGTSSRELPAITGAEFSRLLSAELSWPESAGIGICGSGDPG